MSKKRVTAPAEQKQQWTAIPARRSKRQDAYWRANMVIALLVGAALLGLLSTLAWMSGAGRAPEVAGYEAPRGSAVAMAAAQQFLAGRELGVPVAGQDYDSLTSPTGPILTQGPWPHAVERSDVGVASEGATLELEKHTFLFVAGDQLQTLTVPVLIQADGTPTVVGTPAVGPFELPTTGAGLPRPGEPESVSAAVSEKIERWARAYLENRDVELADIAGDPTGSYQGLGGWTLETVSVARYFKSSLGSSRYSHVAHVTVRAVKDGVQMTQLYELAIQESGQVPVIVEWGPLGMVR